VCLHPDTKAAVPVIATIAQAAMIEFNFFIPFPWFYIPAATVTAIRWFLCCYPDISLKQYFTVDYQV
jgi:hypothetical protein